MSRSSSLTSSPPREKLVSDRSRARRRFRPLRLILILLIVAVAGLFEPNTFRFLAAQCIRLEAWSRGASVHIGGMDGSMFDPLVFRNTVWLYESSTGPVTRVEIDAATAEFSLRNLLPRGTGPWFQRLTITGLKGKIQFPLETGEPAAGARWFSRKLPRPSGRWMPSPERIEATGVDFIFQSNSDYVRVADTSFVLSKVEGGTIHAGQIIIKQPWLNRTFRDVHGATAIQEAKVDVANLMLAPEVQVRTLSAKLDHLARGQLNLNLALDAFGGRMVFDAATLSSQRPFSFEATVNFEQINIGKLATFLGVSEAAGGTIKQGTLKFRGPPQQLARATASLRLEATNFQWESRQWDALVLGASLMDGKVQIPELALAQGHNRLNLTGDMALPAPGVAWWQSEFSLNIAARIDDLTELSALMLPDFQFAAGKANIDGSIRGKDQQFNGQLIVSGSNLRWHEAPIEELHAGVRINGNEFQLTNVSLFNNGDYVRGHGVVNIIGDKQYWGEIHASIEDLDKYAALLEKPIVPEPLAGGAVIDWSGEGSAKGHSGKFSARLRKLRSLGTTAALLHPINADLDGNYALGAMQFSRFMLWDDYSSFTADVGVGNKALSLQGIKLYNRQALWLEGDALLPFDVWNSWPNTTLAKLLDEQTVSKVNLTAYNLSLKEASQLTGWKFPVEGIVVGNLVAEGPLNGLKTSGKLTLSKGRIPLGWSGDALTGVEGDATFEGPAVTIKKLSGAHPTGDFSITGQMFLADVRNPSLQLAVASVKTDLELFQGKEAKATATIGAQLQIAGPLNHAAVTGAATIASFHLPEWNPGTWSPGSRGLSCPPVLTLPTAPWSDWAFDVAIATPAPAPGFPAYTPQSGKGTLSVAITTPPPVPGSPAHIPQSGKSGDPFASLEANLRLTGAGKSPELTGDTKIAGLSLRNGDFRLDEATVTFRPGLNDDPSVSAKVTSAIFGEPFVVHLAGTLKHPMRFLVFGPPLTEKVLLADLDRKEPRRDGIAVETNYRFELRVPAEFFDGVDIVEWPASSPPPPPPSPLPPPANNPAPAASPAPVPAPAPAPAPATPAPATPVPPAKTTPAAAPPAPAAVPTAPANPASTAPSPPVPPAPVPAPAASPVTGGAPTCSRARRGQMSNPFLPGRRTGLFIGRYFGIEFYLDVSWFLIAAIVTYTLAAEYFPAVPLLKDRSPVLYYSLGGAAALLFFLSILLHELGHSLVSQRCGIPVPRITLLFIGGLAEISREPDTARSELKIALGGPAVSVLLAGFYAACAWLFSSQNAPESYAVCLWLAEVNVGLAVFNMFPGYPLDGGRVLRAILWAKTGRLRYSTYITSRIGIGFSWALMALGAYLVLKKQWNGMVFLFIAFFLKSAAESGYYNALQREMLADVKVRDLMTANPAVIPEHVPLNLAVDDFFMSGHHVAYPVCAPDGQFRGLLRLDFLKDVPREKWPFVTAGDVVAERSADDLCIGVEQPAARAMTMLLAPNLNRLAVVEDGKLVGIVTRHDLLQFIKIHAELEG